MIVSKEEFSSRFPAIVRQTEAGDLDALLGALALREIPKDSVLIHDGDIAHTMYLVWEGTLVAYTESDTVSIELSHIPAGETVGEVALLDPGPSTATVKALTDCTLLALSSDSFSVLDRAHPTLTSGLLRMLSSELIERLNAADELLLGFEQEEGGKTKDWFTRLYRRLMGHREKTA